MHRCDEGYSGKGEVGGGSDSEGEMAMSAVALNGGNQHGIGEELFLDELEVSMGWLVREDREGSSESGNWCATDSVMVVRKNAKACASDN
jgi:hypothetical protein